MVEPSGSNFFSVASVSFFFMVFLVGVVVVVVLVLEAVGFQVSFKLRVSHKARNRYDIVVCVIVGVLESY